MQFQPPWHGQGPLPPDQTRLVRVLSNLALNPAREGAATASRGSLTTLTVKNFFLIPNVNRHFPSLLILVEESVGSGEEASDWDLQVGISVRAGLLSPVFFSLQFQASNLCGASVFCMFWNVSAPRSAILAIFCCIGELLITCNWSLCCKLAYYKKLLCKCGCNVITCWKLKPKLWGNIWSNLAAAAYRCKQNKTVTAKQNQRDLLKGK